MEPSATETAARSPEPAPATDTDTTQPPAADVPAAEATTLPVPPVVAAAPPKRAAVAPPRRRYDPRCANAMFRWQQGEALSWSDMSYVRNGCAPQPR
jgi:hypothetical protein